MRREVAERERNTPVAVKQIRLAGLKIIVEERLILLVKNCQTALVFMTCVAMYGNGWQTGMIKATMRAVPERNPKGPIEWQKSCCARWGVEYTKWLASYDRPYWDKPKCSSQRYWLPLLQ